MFWLDQDYLDNEEEFPIYQFQVSTALGRVVGFFDELEVFNVILLDPLHNIFPTKKFDYRVDRTNLLNCKYTNLILELEKVKQRRCTGDACPVGEAIREIPGPQHEYDVTILKLEYDIKVKAERLIASGQFDSFHDIFRIAIELCDEEAGREAT